MPLASQWIAGNVKLLRGPLSEVDLDELTSVPFGTNDDQVDCASGAFGKLANAGGPIQRGAVPKALRDWTGMNA